MRLARDRVFGGETLRTVSRGRSRGLRHRGLSTCPDPPRGLNNPRARTRFPEGRPKVSYTHCDETTTSKSVSKLKHGRVRKQGARQRPPAKPEVLGVALSLFVSCDHTPVCRGRNEPHF